MTDAPLGESQKRVMVESYLFFLTHPEIPPLLDKASKSKFIAIENEKGQTIWDAAKSIQEEDIEMKSYSLVFRDTIVVGDFEKAVIETKFPYALEFSMAHFRRPEDPIGVNPDTIDARERGEGTPEPLAVETIEKTDQTTEIPDKAYPIYEMADDLLFDAKGDLHLKIQQDPKGIFFARFNIISSTSKGQPAFLPFEIKGRTEADVREKFERFLAEDMPNY